MRYISPNGGFVVKAGYAFSFDWHSFPNYSLSPYDLILGVVNNSIVDVGWHRVEDTLRVYRDKGDDVEVSFGQGGLEEIPYDSAEDYRRYGSTADALPILRSVLEGRDLYGFDFDNEHQVRHATYRGDVGPSLSDDLITTTGLTPTAQSFWSLDVPTFDNPVGVGYALDRVDCYPDLSGWQYVVDEDRSSHSFLHKDLRVVLRYLVDLGQVFRYSTTNVGFDHYCQISNMTLTEWAYGCRFEYIQTYGRTVSSVAEFTWNVSITWTWDGRFDTDVPLIHTESGKHTLRGGRDVSMRVKRTYTSCNNALYETDFGTTIGQVDDTTIGYADVNWVYFSRAVKANGTGSDPDIARFLREGPLGSFYERVRAVSGDIRASHYQSAGDAMDQIVGGISSNLLQTFAKANQLSALMPDIQLAIRSVEKLKRGQPLTSLGDWLSFVSGLRLQSSFMWRPDVELLARHLPTMLEIFRRFGQLENSDKYVIGHGVYRYDFPAGEFGREKTTLTTRTRVAVYPRSLEVAQVFLDTKSLGVLPSVSQAWDLIPFSFVVNWIVGIGPRLRDFESVSLLQLIGPRVSTHTFLIESDLTQDELSRGRFAPASYQGSATPAMRVFVREVTSHVPCVIDTKYDFRFPTRLPDLLTAASLFWQLAK